MCGIAGIFAYHYAASEVDRRELRAIRDSMITRGPDAQGEWFSPNGRIGLAHRRLSVIDLSEKASQPMVSACKRYIISYNGEIYNYESLRSELERKGVTFKTSSDTEVILELFAEEGSGMTSKLRGMFAFAIWDSLKNSLFLARDPYGIKPLYYANDGWAIRIASQVKALLTSSHVSRAYDLAGEAGFYLFGSIPEPHTLYQEIRQLPAGSYLWVDELGPAEPKKYFSFPAEVHSFISENSKEKPTLELGDAVTDSLKHHLVSDVPVGVFLSSGIDSSVLFALSSSLQKNPLNTFTLTFEEFEKTTEDEGVGAAKISEIFGGKHHSHTISEQSFIRELPKIFKSMDQPSIDGINTYFVSKVAHDSGLKVVMSGLGADEIFGGYPSFEAIPAFIKKYGVFSKIPFFYQLFQQLLKPFINNGYLHPKAAGVFRYAGSVSGAYFLKRGLFMPWELPQLMGREQAQEGLRRFNLLHYISESISPEPESLFAKVSLMESSIYMRNQLLRDADWAGMAHSLEIRTPFVDTTFFRNLFRNLPSLEVGGKQSLAKLIDPPLPKEILERKKTGFSIPMDKWIQNPALSVWKESSLLTGSSCHSARRWAYVVLNSLKAAA